MFHRKILLPLVVLLLATGRADVLADEASHRAAVARLFELTEMQQKIGESINVLTQQLTLSPELHGHKTAVREFLERHIGWQSLEEALTEMYVQEFTEQEVNDMNAFYDSATGKKVIERLPVLIEQRNRLSSQRVQQNIGELQYEIKARQAKEKESAEKQ
jgi:hypothetical protein